MEYKIISCTAWAAETAVKVLEKKVNDCMQEGWEPIGGITMNVVNGYVYQSLIKKHTAVKK